MSTSLVNARRRADERRAEAAAARTRLASRHGRASDELTTMVVDPAGNPVHIEFSAEVLDVTTERWALSLQAVHRRARESVPERTEHLPRTTRDRRSGPTTPGKPLAAEQEATRQATDQMVARYAERPMLTEATGSAREVWITVSAAKQLVTARATPIALQRGPAALAAAVTDAWADARRQLLDRSGAGGEG